MSLSNASPSKKPFEEASQLSRQDQIRMTIANSKNPYLQARYAFLQENKAIALQALNQQLDEHRDTAIETLTQQKMDERRDKPHLDYRPSDLPANEQKTLRRAARADAKATYEMHCDNAVQDLEQRYEKQAERLLANHEKLANAPRPSEPFNSHSQEQSRGRSL